MVKPRIGAQEREVVGCLGGIQPNHFSALFEWAEKSLLESMALRSGIEKTPFLWGGRNTS